METVKTEYLIPDGSTYKKASFDTSADSILAGTNQVIPSAIASGATLSTLGHSPIPVVAAQEFINRFSNIKIVISAVQPNAETGYNILWINTNTIQ